MPNSMQICGDFCKYPVLFVYYLQEWKEVIYECFH